MEISAVLLAFNEEANIEGTVSKSVSALKKLFDRYELIIVDDGSTDRTGKIADQLAQAHPEIRVVHHAQNQGIGPSLLRGLQEARFEFVTHNGMDYCFDFADLARMMPLTLEADIVVAVRHAYAGYTRFRRFASWVNLTLLQFLFNLQLQDYNFTQVYRNKVLRQICPQLQARSPAFVVPEILLRAHASGFKIREIPIDYHARKIGSSSCARWDVIMNSLFDLIRFWLKTRVQRWQK